MGLGRLFGGATGCEGRGGSWVCRDGRKLLSRLMSVWFLAFFLILLRRGRCGMVYGSGFDV